MKLRLGKRLCLFVAAVSVIHALRGVLSYLLSSDTLGTRNIRSGSTLSVENRIITSYPHHVQYEDWLQWRNGSLSNFKDNLSSFLKPENAIRIFKEEFQLTSQGFRQEYSTTFNVTLPEATKKKTYSVPLQKMCAVVGNGGILRNSRCGDEIDKNDYVIRFNLPDVSNYVRDVGSKTNLTVMNVLTCLRMYNSLAAGKKTFFPGEVSKKEAIKRFRKLKNSVLWYPDSLKANCTSEMLTYVLQKIKSDFDLSVRVGYTIYGDLSNFTKRFLGLSGLPTVGMRTVLVALLLCDDVTVYGFYPFQTDSSGKTIPHHYYGAWSHKTNKYEKSVHGWNEEFELLKSYHERGMIRLVVNKCA
ncbi:alpha-2,8-sialyltransferase 8B-like [Ptychodera flava]|uniref:alpha-2,8-sialyltransferase 8B-like n=1 Tax=Ptychodera flava TaxID=63121 RepID=UPI00396A23FC